MRSWTASPLTPSLAHAEIRVATARPNSSRPRPCGRVFSQLSGGTLSFLQSLEACVPQHVVFSQFGESNIGDHLRFNPDGVWTFQRLRQWRRLTVQRANTSFGRVERTNLAAVMLGVAIFEQPTMQPRGEVD